VDGRDRTAFAAAHLPGSLNIELDSDFASYVGWLVPFGRPVVLVLPDPAEVAAREAVTQLLRIGYDWVPGWLDGGVEAWLRAGNEVARYEIAALRDAATATDATVLDVRQPREWASEGVIPGSRQMFVADLPGHLDELPRDRPITVVCASGYRASIAASLLDRAGFDVRLVAHGGVPTWPAPRVPYEPAAAQGAPA
jgi:rhodanese-related sulfurtransferase